MVKKQTQVLSYNSQAIKHSLSAHSRNLIFSGTVCISMLFVILAVVFPHVQLLYSVNKVVEDSVEKIGLVESEKTDEPATVLTNQEPKTPPTGPNKPNTQEGTSKLAVSPIVDPDTKPTESSPLPIINEPPIVHNGPAKTCNKVEQYNISWHFDSQYKCGRYANGDWWVVGPVTLIGTMPEPDYTNKLHGWNINPVDGRDTAYDGRIGTTGSTPTGAFSAPMLPKQIQPGSSIVKGLSFPAGHVAPTSHRGWLKTAAVLTIVSSVPASEGQFSFRPAYFGTDKTTYTTTNLRYDRLPQIAKPAGIVLSLDQVSRNFQRVQLDHAVGDEFDSRRMHPAENMQDYGSEIALDNSNAALRLMLNDSNEAKKMALIYYVQAGIDLSNMLEAGAVSRAAGGGAGHGVGRLIPLLFAGSMLNSDRIKNIIYAKHNLFSESYGVYKGQGPVPLWGDKVCTEAEFMRVASGDGRGPRTCRDPAGWIDGGEKPGYVYQSCCTIKSYRYVVTAGYLMPSLLAYWPDESETKLQQYVDRWIDFGAWTKPDPNNRSFNNQYGKYTAASLHGANKNGGNYGSEFADSFWVSHNLSNRVNINYSSL